jgi:hypothetical protein
MTELWPISAYQWPDTRDSPDVRVVDQVKCYNRCVQQTKSTTTQEDIVRSKKSSERGKGNDANGVSAAEVTVNRFAAPTFKFIAASWHRSVQVLQSTSREANQSHEVKN